MLRGVPHDEKIKERTIRFEVLAASETYSGLGVIGNVPQLGSWDLNNLVRLKEDGIIDGHGACACCARSRERVSGGF